MSNTHKLINPDTQIINRTPHDIDIVDNDGNLIVRHKSTGAARVEQNVKFIGFSSDGTAFFESTFGKVIGLSEEAIDTVFIVSSIVKAALPERKDLVVPTGFVRNDKGMIIGATGLTF